QPIGAVGVNRELFAVSRYNVFQHCYLSFLRRSCAGRFHGHSIGAFYSASENLREENLCLPAQVSGILLYAREFTRPRQGSRVLGRRVFAPAANPCSTL